MMRSAATVLRVVIVAPVAGSSHCNIRKVLRTAT